MRWWRTAALLALCTPATGFTLGTVARHATAPRASARMDEESKKRAEEALERAQQRGQSPPLAVPQLGCCASSLGSQPAHRAPSHCLGCSS